MYVVVSGPPASGKSTLAPQVAASLGLPLVAKDTIKDALMSVLDAPNAEASRQLGRAAVQAMLAVAEQSPIGAVIESNFYRCVATAELLRLPGYLVEVFCRCTEEVAWERYRGRAGTRHAGHFDHERTRTSFGTTRSLRRSPDPGRCSKSTPNRRSMLRPWCGSFRQAFSASRRR